MLKFILRLFLRQGLLEMSIDKGVKYHDKNHTGEMLKIMISKNNF